EAEPDGRELRAQAQAGEPRGERDREHPRAGEPEAHRDSERVSHAPSNAPDTPAPTIGRPPGSCFDRIHATTPANTATATSARRRSRGTSSARNATGNTKSTPTLSGSLITPPRSEPTSVATFQVMNRLSSAPSTNRKVRAPRAIDTPYASSVR